MPSTIQLFQWLATTAVFVNAASYIPQMRRLYTTKSSKDISLVTYGIWVGLIAIQAMYLALRQDLFYALGVSAGGLMCLGTCAQAIYYRKNKPHRQRN